MKTSRPIPASSTAARAGSAVAANCAAPAAPARPVTKCERFIVANENSHDRSRPPLVGSYDFAWNGGRLLRARGRRIGALYAAVGLARRLRAAVQARHDVALPHRDRTGTERPRIAQDRAPGFGSGVADEIGRASC